MPVDIDRLVRAIHKVETAFGNGIRFEPAFMPAGYNFWVQGHLLTGKGTLFSDVAKVRWARYGALSAASYGPYQVLYHNAADHGFTGHPTELLDPATCERWCRVFLADLDRRGASTIQELAAGYNAGSFTPAALKYTREYQDKINKAYGDEEP